MRLFQNSTPNPVVLLECVHDQLSNTQLTLGPWQNGFIFLHKEPS